jgi:hypothetical protein
MRTESVMAHRRAGEICESLMPTPSVMPTTRSSPLRGLDRSTVAASGSRFLLRPAREPDKGNFPMPTRCHGADENFSQFPETIGSLWKGSAAFPEPTGIDRALLQSDTLLFVGLEPLACDPDRDASGRGQASGEWAADYEHAVGT